ncbi:MAG TPA: thioesterase family protein [Treponemataceae bacterium]|nr:thioesterase family protein [Treponemataceae bacterium]
MSFKAYHRVRSYECDGYNHVNNAVYLNFLEHGRMDFLRHIGFDYEKVVSLGYALYVTHIDIYYKASAFLYDELEISVVPKKLGKISGEFFQEIRKKDGTLCVEAKVTWACVNSSGRPSKIPEDFLVPGLYPKEES